MQRANSHQIWPWNCTKTNEIITLQNKLGDTWKCGLKSNPALWKKIWEDDREEKHTSLHAVLLTVWGACGNERKTLYASRAVLSTVSKAWFCKHVKTRGYMNTRSKKGVNSALKIRGRNLHPRMQWRGTNCLLADLGGGILMDNVGNSLKSKHK